MATKKAAKKPAKKAVKKAAAKKAVKKTVKKAAKKIAEKDPGVAGYAQMTQNNTGGWQLVANTFAHGGRVPLPERDDALGVVGDHHGR